MSSRKTAKEQREPRQLQNQGTTWKRLRSSFDCAFSLYLHPHPFFCAPTCFIHLHVGSFSLLQRTFFVYFLFLCHWDCTYWLDMRAELPDDWFLKRQNAFVCFCSMLFHIFMFSYSRSWKQQMFYLLWFINSSVLIIKIGPLGTGTTWSHTVVCALLLTYKALFSISKMLHICKQKYLLGKYTDIKSMIYKSMHWWNERINHFWLKGLRRLVVLSKSAAIGSKSVVVITVGLWMSAGCSVLQINVSTCLMIVSFEERASQL